MLTVAPRLIVRMNGYMGEVPYRMPPSADAGTVASMFSVTIVPMILPLFSFGIRSASNAL